MADRETGNRRQLTLPEAAEFLHMSEEAVRALVGAGYLASAAADAPPDRLGFPMVELKAFLARNADYGSGNLFDAFDTETADPRALLEALDGKSEEMARRAYDIFASVFPDTSSWSMTQQARFIEQAKARFEAILAVTGQGVEVDDALVDDLEEVGANAAWADSSLPELLIVLRISRDLVVQTAVELAEERGRHWGLALSLLLTRVLPAMDRLTDSLAQGYWHATLAREEESKARYRDVVEYSSDGIYEVDLDGLLEYANPSLAIIVGRRADELENAVIRDVLPGVTADTTTAQQISVLRPDGVRRVLEVMSIPRQHEGMLQGFQGVVRDVTAAHDLEAEKNEFLALVTFDLRQPLTTVLGLGATLESHASELDAERIKRMGGSIRRHAERIARLADDLYDMSRLDAHALLLSSRPVDLAEAIDNALSSVDDPAAVTVTVPSGIMVQGDPRRVEQVVANLVDNALQYGEAPVTVELADTGAASVQFAVVDRGSGVPAAQVGTLFARVATLSRRNRDRSRGTGLGLSLVQGLVQAMGGQVAYERDSGGGARFLVSLPLARHP
ncbi:MAG: PAS domain S-box protein [Actinobacteria bacterium]|nr:PAS domain S-box protein [Actinomycetota bacterium]